MGCDYYIITNLDIQHSQGTSSIELDKQRNYFSYNNNNIDSDESDYEEQMKKYYDSYLEVNYKPKILYGIFEPNQGEIKTLLDTEPRWKNEIIKTKYQEQVKHELNELNCAIPIIVYKIIKQEVRYLR